MQTRILGTDAQGREARLYTLTNRNGLSVTLCDYGARLHAILMPDRHGRVADVCLGFDELRCYETRSGYLGATIGRYCNRIAGASFDLNGKTYTLFKNNGANTLHGGQVGFDKKIWDTTPTQDGIIFRYTSPDGEEGFPGTLMTQARFTLGEDGSLAIDYEAVSDQDTVINLTSHAYFNLAGSGTIHNHSLQVDADSVTQARADLIPDGTFLPVTGTPFDLRSPARIGDRLAMRGVSPMFDKAWGYDVNYVLNGAGFRQVAELSDPESGRRMQVLTDQPGLQVYSGQGLTGPGKDGRLHVPYSGIALETQHHPDSVHHPHFPDTVLRAGEVFRSRTVYRFTAE